jgi:hypothetical protein
MFWKPVVKRYPDIDWNRAFAVNALRWLAGSVGAFCFCFGIGNGMFKRFYLSAALVSIAGALFLGILTSIMAQRRP